MKTLKDIMDAAAAKAKEVKAITAATLPEKQHAQAAVKAEFAGEGLVALANTGYTPLTLRFDRKAVAHATFGVPRTLADRQTAYLEARAKAAEAAAARKAANTPEAKAKAAAEAIAKRKAMSPAERALEMARHNAKMAAKAARKAVKELAEERAAEAKLKELAAA